MDVLGDILRVIRLKGSVYFNACFCSPWGMALEQSSRSAFHLVVSGEAWLKMDSMQQPIRLCAGDIVLIPLGAPHSISDQPDSICISGDKVVSVYQSGHSLFDGDGDESKVVCGYVEFDQSMSHPFLRNLPEYIQVKAALSSQFNWLDSAIEQIVFESEGNRPGRDVLVDKFTEILFIQIIRAFAEQKSSQPAYLSALMDQPLSHALSLIHNEPEQNWSVEQLANQVGMSRSVFYNRFNDYIGVAPMKYLFEWRMMMAKQKLKQTQKPINLIAEEVGYQSVSAFQKAFKRFYKYTPAWLRNNAKRTA